MLKVDKKTAARFLGKSAPECAFWCRDGKIFADFVGLNAALKAMTLETYLYHANKQKNDFSKWVADVFGDKKLAEDLKKAKNKSEAAKKVELRIAYLKKFLK